MDRSSNKVEKLKSKPDVQISDLQIKRVLSL